MPPHLQSELALRAHRTPASTSLLEKPIATSLQAGGTPASQPRRAHGVAAVVFFTMLYDPRSARSSSEVATDAAWTGGSGLWLGSALNDENPFNTPWRHEKGGLWDLGPHAISVLWNTLGPIVAARRAGGAATSCTWSLTTTTGAHRRRR